MQYMHMIYMYQYKRYVGDLDICLCYIVLVQNSVLFHLAFASARLMALRWSVAGRALDFKEELCGVCLCIYMLLKPTAYPIHGWAGRGLPLPAILFSVGSTLRAPGVGCRTSW